MAKREFLQLCQQYNPTKHSVNGWYLSEKLDGMRCFWDGGISRGKRAPWANDTKDNRLINPPVGTGLYSRMGKVIVAPEWWIDMLPPFPLDGELWMGRGRFQELTSIVKRLDGESDWEDVEYRVFDSPPLDTIFADGTVEVRYGAQKYSRRFSGIMSWIQSNTVKGRFHTLLSRPYEQVLEYLKNNVKETENLIVHPQTRLPFSTPKAREIIEELLDKVVATGGEGVILRSHWEHWEAARSHHCLKYKPILDSEAEVIGYVWGREGKLLGLMGTLVVSWRGQVFELSGFTEAERSMTVRDEGRPGRPVQDGVSNYRFPIGSVVTFRYRELTDRGLPKEARYWRKHA